MGWVVSHTAWVLAHLSQLSLLHDCRIMGSLLSAHLLITDPEQVFGDLVPEHYEGELLTMAHDLADRLLPAFENSHTGLPLPRVSWFKQLIMTV